jgi:hypothetical protein
VQAAAAWLARCTLLNYLAGAACRARTQVWGRPRAPPPPSPAAPPPAEEAAAAGATSSSHRRRFAFFDHGVDDGGGRAMLGLKVVLAVLLTSAVAISGSLSYSLGASQRASWRRP